MSDIIVPKVGLTIEEVEVIEWLVAVGDTIAADQPLLTINADKTEVEIVADAAGVLASIAAPPGAIVAVGGVLGTLQTEQAIDQQPASGAPTATPPSDSAPTLTVSIPPPAAAPIVPPPAPSSPPAPVEMAPPPASTRVGRQAVSPYARRLAHELNVPIGEVEGTGPSGRIVARDIGNALSRRPRAPEPGRLVVRANVDLVEFRHVIASLGEALDDRDGMEIWEWAAHQASTTLQSSNSTIATTTALGTVTSGATAALIEPSLGDIRRAVSDADGPATITLVDLRDTPINAAEIAPPVGGAMAVAIGPARTEPVRRLGRPAQRPRARVTLTADTTLVSSAEANEFFQALLRRVALAGDLLWDD